MHIMMTDLDVESMGVVERLATRASGVTVGTLAPGEDLEEACEREARPHEAALLVVTRVPLPENVRKRRPDLAVLYPGRSDHRNDTHAESGVGVLLPGFVIGPLVGPPEASHRALAGAVRKLGVATSCRPEMHTWLRVTSAWLAPLRGAAIAAARQGCQLGTTEDLITVATRAVRERLLLMRVGGFPLDVRHHLLLAAPEIWAIGAIRKLLRTIPADACTPWLPSPAQAAAVSRSAARLAGVLRMRTPAADFLDQFSLEEAGDRGGDRHEASEHRPATPAPDAPGVTLRHHPER